MRKSVLKNDPGYHIEAYKYQAYLDGKKVVACVTADEEKGFVDVYQADGSNQKIERILGKVELKIERPIYKKV